MVTSSRDFKYQITNPPILHRGGSLRINGFSKKSVDFAGDTHEDFEKVLISLDTSGNSAFGDSKIDTPIEDPNWSGRFVEKI